MSAVPGLAVADSVGLLERLLVPRVGPSQQIIMMAKGLILFLILPIHYSLAISIHKRRLCIFFFSVLTSHHGWLRN